MVSPASGAVTDSLTGLLSELPRSLMAVLLVESVKDSNRPGKPHQTYEDDDQHDAMQQRGEHLGHGRHWPFTSRCTRWTPLRACITMSITMSGGRFSRR